MQETQVWSLGWEDPLEEEMATHSSILVWKIPRTEEPGRLQSMVLQRVGHSWVTKHIYHFCCRPDRYWRQPGRLVHVCVTLVALEGPGVCRRVVSVGVCHPREASLATLASVCCPFIEKSHYWGDQDEIPLFPSKCLLTGLCWILSHWETVPLITSWLHIFTSWLPPGRTSWEGSSPPVFPGVPTEPWENMSNLFCQLIEVQVAPLSHVSTPAFLPSFPFLLRLSSTTPLILQALSCVDGVGRIGRALLIDLWRKMVCCLQDLAAK